MEPSPTHKRAVVLMFFLFLWAALVAARLFYFTVPGRSEYLAAGERLSSRTGRIPAFRGRILSSNGSVLAWSEIHTDICLKSIPGRPSRRKRLLGVIRSFAQNFSFEDASEGMVLRSDLSPDEQTRLFPSTLKFRELVFKTRTSRMKANREFSVDIGDTSSQGGRLRGVSGYEKRFDDILRGRDGEFRVMVDKHGRWIPGTWRETVKPENGRDVVVDTGDD